MGKIMKVEITAEGYSPTKTVVKARNFEMVIDEPPMLGGKDEGANPVEYLLGALSGCLNVMAHFIAKEMGIELGKLDIKIEGELDLAGLMGKEDVRPGFKWIKVKMKPESNASKEELKKLIEEVEKRCPVSDNLRNETPVEIELE